ncbi:MAG: hypothetical protein B6U85_05575 [Desulfurococcales archaeon ex4484_42]|nr:MAG: hypothetical protein B6U85_05575 [Desulfurococcales archaeon ex4484_42]
MPLIVESTLYEGFKPRGDVSPMYISVSNKYLSKQYRPPIATCWVEGEILEVSRISGTLSDDERRAFEEYVIGKTVRFYLAPGILHPTITFTLMRIHGPYLGMLGYFPVSIS